MNNNKKKRNSHNLKRNEVHFSVVKKKAFADDKILLFIGNKSFEKTHSNYVFDKKDDKRNIDPLVQMHIST